MSEKREINLEEGYAKKLRYISIALTALFTFSGIYVVFKGWGFFDSSLVYLLIPFIFCVIGFYISMVTERFIAIFSCLIIGLACLVMMTNSFEWRRSYVEQGFLLEAYIDDYPSYTQHLYTKLMNQPDIVSFSNECLGYKGREIIRINLPSQCNSHKEILSYYRVDVNELIKAYHRKMQTTAKQIEAGRASQIAYPFCVNTKRCAYIPLPPEEMTEKQISESEDPKIVILRDGFWDLIEQSHVTANICLNMYLCNRLVELGIFTARDLAALKR